MKAWSQRTLWRALFATALVVGAALKSSIGDGLDSQETIDVVLAGLVAFGGWYGIGAVTSTEPFLNNKEPGSVDVPKPPADPKPAG